MMHIHKWSKWTEPFAANRPYSNEVASLVQHRTCNKCGAVQQRYVGDTPVDGTRKL